MYGTGTATVFSVQRIYVTVLIAAFASSTSSASFIVKEAPLPLSSLSSSNSFLVPYRSDCRLRKASPCWVEVLLPVTKKRAFGTPNFMMASSSGRSAEEDLLATLSQERRNENKVEELTMNKSNRVLVITSPAEIDEYRRILEQDDELTASADLFFFPPNPDDDRDSQISSSSSSSSLSHSDLIAAAKSCNIWFGTPKRLCPLLSSVSRTTMTDEIALPKTTTPAWIQSTFAGVEPFLDQSLPRDYTLTNMRGVFNDLAADFVLGHMFAWLLNIQQHYQANVERTWNPTIGQTTLLSDLTVGILGVGVIGKAVARRCKAIGVKQIMGYTRSSEDCPDIIDQYFHGEEQLIQQMGPLVDVWVCIMPNTPATANTLHQRVFDVMKPGCMIINIGRGTAIVDDDLVEALSRPSTNRYAVLDVFREEPLPASHPFWSMENILITSHTAAKTMPSSAAAVFLDNYRRWVKDRERSLQYVIDFERGY